MANELISATELALWTQNDTADVTADPFAAEVMDKVSELVRFIAGQPTWTMGTAPFDARMIALTVAKRCYENPAQETQTNVGPIGSRVLDVAAMLTALTDVERATLVKYNASGDPDANDAVWVLRGATDTVQLVEPVLYVPDNQQVNLGDTLSWDIPLFSPGDPGDPNLYPEAP